MVGRPPTQFSHLRVDEGVLVITLTRTGAGNALHPPANKELSAVFDWFLQDRELDVAVLTGGIAVPFCSGVDLEFLRDHGPSPLPPAGFGGLTSRFERRKPVIAAIGGDARGAGFELALACDLIIASETARFVFDQPLYGQVPLAGGVHRAARYLSLKQAMGLLLTAREITAPEGVFLGLVHQMTLAGQVVSSAMTAARQIQRRL